MNVKFVIRKTKIGKDGQVPIEMSICIKGNRRFVSSGRKVTPQMFNEKTQKVKGDDSINQLLDAMKSRVYGIETILLNKGINVSVDTVLDVYRNGEKEKTITFLQLFDLHNANIKKKVEQRIVTESTLGKYIVTKDYVTNYLKEELNKDDILVKDITPGFIDNLFVYLLKYMSNNTAIQKMKQVKKIIRVAMEEGYIQSSPFKVTMKKDKVEVEPLTIKEVNKIKNKKIECKRLEKIRDLFIFGCYTGLAFTDLMGLDASDFITDEDGNRWIVKKRHKTNVVATIPLLPIALEILKKYDNHLPTISNVKYNAYLKEIADICGIKKSLHSHIARHTFATSLLNAGMDMVLVSKCLGHSNSRITESTYAKVLPSKLCEKVKEVEKKFKEEGAF